MQRWHRRWKCMPAYMWRLFFLWQPGCNYDFGTMKTTQFHPSVSRVRLRPQIHYTCDKMSVASVCEAKSSVSVSHLMLCWSSSPILFLPSLLISFIKFRPSFKLFYRPVHTILPSVLRFLQSVFFLPSIFIFCLSVFILLSFLSCSSTAHNPANFVEIPPQKRCINCATPHWGVIIERRVDSFSAPRSYGLQFASK